MEVGRKHVVEVKKGQWWAKKGGGGRKWVVVGQKHIVEVEKGWWAKKGWWESKSGGGNENHEKKNLHRPKRQCISQTLSTSPPHP